MKESVHKKARENLNQGSAELISEFVFLKREEIANQFVPNRVTSGTIKAEGLMIGGGAYGHR